MAEVPVNEVVAQAIADHQAMSEFVENLSHVSNIVEESDALAKVGKMRMFLERHIKEHFTIEELIVFPELCRRRPEGCVSELVGQLEIEHEQVRKMVADMNALLTQAESIPETELLERIQQAFYQVLGQLQRHAAKEDAMLVPLLKELQDEPL